MQSISSSAVAFGSPGNTKKYSGKELANKEFTDGSGLEWYEYGARDYDVQISRWFCIDRLAEKYYGVSPYAFVVNDPILLTDPDGQRIKIKYRDEEGHKRKAFYDAHQGIATDKKGKIVHGDFVDKVVKSLNQVKAVDQNKVIESVADNKKVVTIKRAGYGDKHENEFKDGIFHLGLSKKIFFNPDRAAETYKLIPWKNPITGNNQPENEMTGALSPSMILFHELGHVFNYFNDRSTTLHRLRTPTGDDYGNSEEQLVIDKYETPAAVLLGQGTRNHHRDLHTFPVNDPTQTK